MIESDSASDLSPTTVFGTASYLEPLATVSGLTVEHVRTQRSALHAATRRRGPISEVVLPLFTPFSGVSVSELTESEVHGRSDPLAELAATLESRFQRIRLHLPSAIRDVRPLQWRGWDVSPLYTYVLRPADRTATWSSGARRTLKKHQGEYETSIDPNAISDVVRLMISSYRRHDRHSPVDSGAMVAACRELVEAGSAECVVATTGSRVAAGIVLLHGVEASYYWIAGSEPGPAMTVLMSFVSGLLAERGVESLDMVGANTPSIAEFKRRLGAEMVSYWAATYESGLLARGYRSLKHLMGTR